MQGREPDMQFAIHAGAAFTDQGRLQRSLQANGALLSECGARFFGPRRYRQYFKPNFGGPDIRTLSPDAIKKMRLALPVDAATKRAIFLNDNFVGDQGNLLRDGQLYPDAGRRMALLQQAFPEEPINLYFALRNPGSFIPKLLMALPDPDREEILRTTDLSCLSWIGMIEDIRDLAPDVKITLWCNEDTPLIWGNVVRQVSGIPETAALTGEYDLILSLLTAEGQVLAQAALDTEANDPEALQVQLFHIFEEHAETDRLEEELELPGWNAEIVDAFSELYEQDVARLANMSGVQVLSPRNAPL
ncbi:hypothetical protein [Ruegeria lacuscaerulensis]|uniref:hypothetical protein n=1 Tax=Ruegeria lacuscaerulensis TaxID=55218 RepID=UPI00147E5D88|nr:hypothetical protein [Ruegeria lacuscaerulensis]